MEERVRRAFAVFDDVWRWNVLDLKYRRTRLFVLTLGCSRKAVRLLVWQSSTQTWAALHERAVRRLGGTLPAPSARFSEAFTSGHEMH